MNYFELFGFEEKPYADKAAASKKYVELQKRFHPDFFSNDTETEQEQALQQSAAINKAYNIFKDPDKTIEYFLQQKGVITTDEKYSLPPDFLMEMMELNESFDEKESTAVQSDIAGFQKNMDAGIGSLLSPATGELSADNLQQLKAYYYKKKYLKRILDRFGD